MRSGNRPTLLGLLSMLLVVLACQPAAAQVSLVGDWVFTERAFPHLTDHDLGEYFGMPMRPEARQGGDSWSESRWTMLNRGCTPYAAAASIRYPQVLRISEERDPATQELVAIKTFSATFAQTRMLWLDDRPAPHLLSQHTWQGFSRAKWTGNKLVVTTTHLKQFWHRRNGIFSSDNTKLTEYFIRHGNYLNYIIISEDPAILTHPLVYSETFVQVPDIQTQRWQTHLDCQPDEEIAGRDPGYVPHTMPWDKAYSEEAAKKYGIPVEGVRGGVETIYPEYIQKMKQWLSTTPRKDPRSTASR